MTSKLRIFRRVLASVLLILVIGGAIGLLAAVDDRPASERARDWAISAGENLPLTVGELAALPAEYRMAAFAEMTPAEKSALFREQIEPLTRVGSATQRQLAVEISLALAPDAYTPEGRAAAQALLAPLCKQIRTVMDKRDWPLFGSIAPGRDPEKSFGDFLRAAKRSLISLPLLASGDSTPRSECECSIGSGCQIPCISDGGKVCQASGCSTPPWYRNFCGCGLIWDCDGTCQTIIPS